MEEREQPMSRDSTLDISGKKCCPPSSSTRSSKRVRRPPVAFKYLEDGDSEQFDLLQQAFENSMSVFSFQL